MSTEPITPPARIAWIGTGVMGAPMAGHLLDAGYELIVHTRTRAKAESLLERGAAWADTPRLAAEGADVAASIVGFPADVESTFLGSEGVLAANDPPRLVIDFTTSRPSLAERIATAASAQGVSSIDAPVSGGDVGARGGTLSIMVGAAPADFERVRPIFDILGARAVRQGGPGSGQHTKMVNQILIASGMMGVCEGLIYAKRAGLDPMQVIESVGAGAAGSWSINNLGPRIIRGDFEPGFFVEHFIKDLGIALDEAARLGVALPGLALARQFYDAAAAQGFGRQGTQVLAVVLGRLSGVSF